VIETADRQLIEALLIDVGNNVALPVHLHHEIWHVSCFFGVALLGRDSNTPKELLDQARIAAGEARRAMSARAQFFSDTMKLKSLARLDVGRELRGALRSNEIRMRYLGRYDLTSGRLDAQVGYVTWQHPMRGLVAPKEFLKVAEASGMSLTLSRDMLRILHTDIACMSLRAQLEVRFSFGPLRHHLLHRDFIRDLESFLETAPLSADRLEIRIDERSFIALRPRVVAELHRIGVRVVVDEVGRNMTSLSKLAASSLWGIQLDRALVEDIQSNAVALRQCQASIGAAAALGLSSIATGVDDDSTRRLLIASGCRFGCGDLFDSRAHTRDRPPPNGVVTRKGGRPQSCEK
jgi:predicted signal transduction protein with EAL and GGDEF domain